jgi:ATP-dependent DNA helicase RecG
MAPTELLAEQHGRNFSNWFAAFDLPLTMLTGKRNAAVRTRALTDLASGAARIAIGTHALFQEGVEFQKLGLVIVDEQHRFGVHQRLLLREKGRVSGRFPHQLIMTATPIPRTLAMTAYADLDVSIIDELPPGRTPVKTVAMTDNRRDEVVVRIRDACRQKRQAYWVCPLVEESEELDAQAAEATATALAEALSELTVALVHGRMAPREKEAIMTRFKEGKIDLLVATTVIEVGVDVPNSTAMVILDADRFGLSQLHQLRGRVGRGSAPGVCLLVTDMPAGTTARERLDAVASTTDGFELARMDLELRREGDVLGSLQSGSRSGLRLLSLLRHEEIIAKARGYATEIVEGDPGLARHPGLHALVAETVGDEERAAYLDKV